MKIIIAGVLVIFAFAASAQNPAIVTGVKKGWYQIGKVSAGFKSERESIVVMGKDEFETIKLRVEYAPINIEKMQVYFEGGEIQEIDVKQPLKAGEETDEFALKSENKEIDKVVFYYRTVGNADGEKAAVELYGYKEQRYRESAGVRDDEDLRDDASEDGSAIQNESNVNERTQREEYRIRN
jgi:hypothetical protein